MSSHEDDPKEADAASPRQWISLVVVYLSIPLVLLVCGGEVGWWQAWVYSALIVATGPCGRVWAERRHPGYAGNSFALLGIVLALSSVWTLIPAVVALVITVARTVLEDQTLKDELPGYGDYARRVRYRLMPGIY